MATPRPLCSLRSTKEVFLKRQAEEGGEHEQDITKLSLDSPQMVLRRKMLTHWLAKIITADFDDIKVRPPRGLCYAPDISLTSHLLTHSITHYPVLVMQVWEFMDRVGVMHTGQPAFKHRLNRQPLHVDLHTLTLTLGWVTDIVITIVMEFPKAVLSTSKKAAVLKAFNKLIWLQQDLFQRHYVRTDEEAAVNLAKVRDKAHADLLAEKMSDARLQTPVEVREEAEAREAADALPEVEVK